MERHGGEGNGRRRKKKTEGVKQKRSGWQAVGTKEVSSGLWNQELIVVLYTATTLHRRWNTNTSTHALYPHNLCSTSVQLECRLSAPTHPIYIYCNTEEKREAASQSKTAAICGLLTAGEREIFIIRSHRQNLKIRHVCLLRCLVLLQKYPCQAKNVFLSSRSKVWFHTRLY